MKEDSLDKGYIKSQIKGLIQLKNCLVTVDGTDNTVVVMYDDGKNSFIISGIAIQTYFKVEKDEIAPEKV